MDLERRIEELMRDADELKKRPDVDKKALNKMNARLEDAWLWSRLLFKSAEVKGPDGQMTTAGVCTCPAGVQDTRCPVHGKL